MLSVVIPVYNVQDYLTQCIESVLNQTYQDIEVILVDDGSTDRSLSICKSFEQKDKRVHVIQQEHKKAAAARNMGIRLAKGEFLTFVDSDDFVDLTAYDKLLKIMQENKLDVIRGSYRIEKNGCYCDDIARKQIGRDVMSGAAFFNCVYGKNIYCAHVGIGIYRTNYIRDNNLYFFEGITHEDELWIPRMVVHANRIQYVDCYFYYYRYREGSVMRKKDHTQNGVDCVTVAYQLAKETVPKQCRRAWNDNILGKYFFGFTWARMYRAEYRKGLSSWFVVKHVSSFKNGIRACVYLISYKLFYILNKKACKL